MIDASLRMGGAEVLVTNMMELLRSRGHDVELAILNGERTMLYERLEKSNFKIHVVGARYKSPYDPRRIPMLKKLMKRFDIVHTHTSPAQIMTAFASIGLTKNLITTEHSSNNRRRNKAIFKLIDLIVYGRYQTIVGCSEDASKSLLSYIPQFSDKIVTIKNGIDINKIQAANPCEDIQHSRNHINLIMVGRFQHPKDQLTLVNALKYLPESVHVYFVGDGPTRMTVEIQAKEIGVANRTHFLGIRDDIPNLLKASDIAVHSSYWEGLPLSILEEMAAGCPVAASDSRGITSIVEGAGLLFNAGDENDLAAKITCLLNDKKLYNDTSRKCMERAQEYDIEKMTDAYLKYYLASV